MSLPRRESVLLHFLPAEVFRQLVERAERLQREEAFHRYVISRIWFILPTLLLIFAIGLVGAFIAIFAVLSVVSLLRVEPLSEYAVIVVILGPALIGFALTILPLLNCFFAWLEARVPQAGR